MREYKNFGGVMNMANIEQIDARRPIKTPYDLEAERASLALWIGISGVCLFILIVDHVNPEIIDRILG